MEAADKGLVDFHPEGQRRKSHVATAASESLFDSEDVLPPTQLQEDTRPSRPGTHT